ncbi:DUF3168 domain-containing protein [Pedobacter sp. MC2016-24]|uniref:DUF3168 domain-containing protein n=1 Tax=Pedobacter sp. MC2016-24 TaxID=2780090 RepID=UPI00187EAC79|nr:DUF3168 domain-containing protein [Pedobacter sp. MC2016-24]MBE9598742.1 DUF3168 domain-containing protein [Pedobacter sp. MC2016-24]
MNEFALDPSNIYRKAYFDKLSNQLSVISGRTIPVYDTVPDDAVAPYVVLSNTTLTPILNTTGYAFKASIVIDIITRFKSGGGKKLADDISNLIFQRILTKENFYSDEDWNIYTSKLESTRYFESESNGGYVIRKLITFNNNIQQM